MNGIIKSDWSFQNGLRGSEVRAMPSSMVHLLAAYKYDPKASTPFLIGSIVPDIIKGWEEKDRNHLRDREDRQGTLCELAHTMDLQYDFQKGILFHLFIDYKWDINLREEFTRRYEGYTWFKPYRHELSLVGSWLYHHTDWSKKVWEELMSYPLEQIENNEYDKYEIKDFLARNYKWHDENYIGSSLFFTPELVEKFTNEAVNEFRDWLDKIVKIVNR